MCTKCVREVETETPGRKDTRTKASAWCYRAPVHKLACKTRSLVRKKRQVYWLLSVKNPSSNSLGGVSGLPPRIHYLSSNHSTAGFGEGVGEGIYPFSALCPSGLGETSQTTTGCGPEPTGKTYSLGVMGKLYPLQICMLRS